MTKPRLALLLSAVILATFVAFGVLYLSPITPAAVSVSAGGPTTAFFVLPFATYAVVGALIAARRPENPIGWLLIGAAALLMIGAFCSLVGSLLHYAHNPAGQWVALGGITWAGGASPLTFLFFLAVMLFPDGHLPSPRWRWLVAVEAVFTALTVAVVLLAPLPLGRARPGAPTCSRRGSPTSPSWSAPSARWPGAARSSTRASSRCWWRRARRRRAPR